MAVEVKLEKPIRMGCVKYHYYRKENSVYRFFSIETDKPRTHFSVNALNDFVKDLQNFVAECDKLEKAREGEQHEAS